jgi:MFS family permease
MTGTSAAVAAPPAAAGSTWAPLRVAVFRAAWIAALLSNLGSWMHIVAAAWLMTTLTASATLVALLLSATSLPSFLLALPAGAMADVFDRRRLILVTQGLQLIVAALLGLLTLTHVVTPWALLALTVALGAGATLGLPAFTAITPDLVSPAELPAAISLNAITMTASQAVGPALGGLLVASAGPGAVFLLNAVSFLAVLVAIGRWRPNAPVATLPPEHVLAAVRTGMRYTANAPELVAVLVRAAAFVAAFSALPALLAVVTRSRLHGTASDYGILLGLVGIGGVLAAALLPRLRTHVTADTLVVAATITDTAVIGAVGTARSVSVLLPVMVLGGFAQMTVMSSLNIAAQQVLPGWVRGRGLAVFMLVFQLGIAGGAAVWGLMAGRFGISVALYSAAVVMALSSLLAPFFRLNPADHLDIRPAYHPEPHGEVPVDPTDGPVMVTVEYDIGTAGASAFTSAARRLRQVRRRAGAVHWAVFEDVERPGTTLETYVVTSWTEHKRQADRRTARDQQVLDEVETLHRSTGRPRERYLLGLHFRRRTTEDEDG